MRRKDRLLSVDDALLILKKGEYGILSTISPLHEPYGIPLNYCYLNGNIYFHCALEGQKLNHLQHSPRVSFCVVGRTQIEPEQFSTKFESTIVQGTAEEVSGEEKQAALEGLIEKYSAQHIVQGKAYIKNAWKKTKVVKIIPHLISGKAKQ